MNTYKNISIEFFAVLGLLLFSFFSVKAQTFDELTNVKLFEKLRTIKLFISTKQDVEKLLNTSSTGESEGNAPTQDVYYKLKEGKVTVYYSTGRCNAGSNSFKGYNVKKDVAVGISILFRDYPRLSAFKINLKKFKIFKQPGNWTFYNDNLGLSFETFASEPHEVMAIDIDPSEKQERFYDCENIK